MYRYLTFAALLVLAILIVPSAGAQAQQIIEIESSVSVNFGAQAHFSATFYTTTPIARAAVFYRPLPGGTTEVLYADLISGNPTLANVRLDLQRAAWQPFSQVEYWWEIELSGGGSQVSETQVFDYFDNRFDWQSLSEGNLRLHWVDGDQAFGRDILALALDSFEHVNAQLALLTTPNMEIFVYPGASDLQSALRLSGQSTVFGHAQPELGVVLVASSPAPEDRLDLERSLPHEMTHVLLYQRLGKGYRNLPPWLNEGLATLQEIAPSPEHRIALEQSASTDQLLTIKDLCSPVPFLYDQTTLAYAQSASFVKYLQEIYGVGAIIALFDAYQEPVSCLGGLQRVFLRTPENLETEWLAFTFQDTESENFYQPLLAWIPLCLPIFLILTGLGVQLRRRTQTGRTIESSI